MPVSIPPDHGQVALLFSVTGLARAMVMTIGYEIATPGEFNPSERAELFRLAWLGRFDPSGLSDGWTFEGCECREHVTGGIVTGDALNPSAGTADQNPVSLAVAAIVTKRSAYGGKANRGRCFLVPGYLGELNVSPTGRIDETLRTDIGIGWRGFLDDFDGTPDVFPRILHHNADPPTAITIDACDCEAIVATQRPRQVRD